MNIGFCQEIHTPALVVIPGCCVILDDLLNLFDLFSFTQKMKTIISPNHSCCDQDACHGRYSINWFLKDNGIEGDSCETENTRIKDIISHNSIVNLKENTAQVTLCFIQSTFRKYLLMTWISTFQGEQGDFQCFSQQFVKEKWWWFYATFPPNWMFTKICIACCYGQGKVYILVYFTLKRSHVAHNF